MLASCVEIARVSRYALGACAAAALLAGCGGLRQTQGDVQPPVGAISPSAAVAHARSNRDPWLYVDGSNDVVDAYDLARSHYPPVRSITQGVDKPAGLKVDSQGTLYVANTGNASVTEYRPGADVPSVTLSVNAPQDTAIDPFTGDLYVDTRTKPAGIFVFRRGKTRPSKDILSKLMVLPAQMFFDSSGTLYIADNQSGVLVLKRGTHRVVSLNLQQLDGCTTGIALDERRREKELYVADCDSGLQVYRLGDEYPIRALNDSVYADYLAIGVLGTREDLFAPNVVSNTVSAYHAKAVNPFWVLTTAANDALGVTIKPAGVP
jgi:hypothetical protein